MEKLSRREFTRNMLGSFFSMSLVATLCDAQALTGSVKPVAHKWLFDMERISKDLRAGRVGVTGWQDQIEALLAKVDMADLLKAIDYERLARTTTLYDDHESAEELSFAKMKGFPGELSFVPFFYGMKKGAAIVPHGHRNMTTMHMMLKGEAHGRLYNRIDDEPDFLTIVPTKDKIMHVGEASTISGKRDNIHWFKAMTEPVFMFNIGVYGLDPDSETTGRDYIDPDRGEKLGNGSIRVPRIDDKTAYRIYGRQI
ncbi:MAG: hypothetical protein QM785_06325 [Pyrinomonadaceae bacterium]